MNKERSFFGPKPEYEHVADDAYRERRQSAANYKKIVAKSSKELSEDAEREARIKKTAEEVLERLKKLPPNPKLEKQ